MSLKKIGKTTIGVALAMGIGFTSTLSVGQMPPFGNEEDTSYATALWQAMLNANMAGDDAIRTFPYEGIEPHGFVLETFYTKTTIDGHTGDLVIKRNYGPEGVSVEEVQDDAAKHLAAITVMFKREDGYDSDNKNWFWAKYLPDGSLDKNPAGMELAGRVAKGNEEAGCISCHIAEDDYLFTTNHIK